MSRLTHIRLKYLLRYDWRTGVFTWLVDRPRGVKSGERAGDMPTKLIDHRDGDRGNNKIENLRHVSLEQNMRNKAPASASGYKGVTKRASGKFDAHIKVNLKTIVLGRVSSAEEAAKLYDVAAKKYFGEFARLNFPEATP